MTCVGNHLKNFTEFHMTSTGTKFSRSQEPGNQCFPKVKFQGKCRMRLPAFITSWECACNSKTTQHKMEIERVLTISRLSDCLCVPIKASSRLKVSNSTPSCPRAITSFIHCFIFIFIIFVEKCIDCHLGYKEKVQKEPYLENVAYIPHNTNDEA